MFVICMKENGVLCHGKAYKVILEEDNRIEIEYEPGKYMFVCNEDYSDFEFHKSNSF